MHFTRLHLDRSASRALLAASLLTASGAAASCSSSDDQSGGAEPLDAAPRDAAIDDARIDAPAVRDAGSVDAASLAVVCASTPCARSLVTTLGASADDRDEGFCVLLDDGTVACWGANRAGQLGRGDDAERVDSANAARVTGLSNIVDLDHTCAVDSSGAVFCWGTGPFLRGDAGARTTERTPVKLDLPPATKVGLGVAVACAATSEGVRCWGSNADGQLGPLATTPAHVPAPELMPMPQGAAVGALAVGRATFVLREDGTLVTWGANPPAGRVSTIFPDPYPQGVELDGISTIDLVHDNACVTAGGTGFCWGARVFANQGTMTERALPAPIVAPEPITRIATTRTRVIEDIGVQRYRWCAVAASGALYCWGLNDSGQAGDGTQGYAYDAVKVDGLPERVAQVRTTASTTCALLTNGKVYCWGGNYYGQLGNGQNRGRSLVPVEVVLP